MRFFFFLWENSKSCQNALTPVLLGNSVNTEHIHSYPVVVVVQPRMLVFD